MKVFALVSLLYIGFLLPLSLAFADVKNTEAVETSTKEAKVISSLQWGEVLFFHFRGDKLDALIRLYARESRNQFQQHQSQADLLAAGLLLDLGLPTEAQHRLEAIKSQPSNNLTPDLQARLALVMARVYFYEQDFVLAEQWLQTADEAYLLEHELPLKQLMQAQLMFSRGEFLLAANQLEQIENKGNLHHYAQYNQGVTLLRLEEKEAKLQGRALLETVADLMPVDQEQYALRDQSQLVLGLDDLNAGQHIEARKRFLNIRMDGLVSYDALLSLGWAFSESKYYEKALNYWKVLADKAEILEPAVQEAWLAVPYAHQKLGDLRQAVAGYEKAIITQNEAQIQLEQLLQDNTWRVLLVPPEENILTDGFVSVNAITTTSGQSIKKMEQSLSRGFTRQLIAAPQFFSLLDKWQQLEQWRLKLKQSLSILPTISLALKTNEQRYKIKSQKISEFLKSQIPQDYYLEQNKLTEQFEKQSKKALSEQFLKKDDYDIWKKLDKDSRIIETIKSEIDIQKIEKYRQLNGVAQWKFHRKSDADRWSARNSLSKLQQTVEKLTEQTRHLQSLIKRSRQSLPQAVKRIEKIKVRGDLATSQLSGLQHELESSMSQMFTGFVRQRQTALKELALQANLAIARLKFQSIQETVKLHNPENSDNE